MTFKEIIKWEGGGTYVDGKCDIPTCDKKPNWRNWVKDVCGFNGDDECIASLCNEHYKGWKVYERSEKIISEFNKTNAKQRGNNKGV